MSWRGNQQPGRKNNLWRKMGTPFEDGGVVVRRATDQFIPTVRFFKEFGGTKEANRFARRLPKP